MDWTPIATQYDPLKAGSIDGTDTEPHDHAVIRAMQAHYVPNKRVVGDPKLTLFITKLHPKTTEETLEKIFSKFGSIRRLRIVRDVVTGFSKRYAFIEFNEEHSIYRAYRDANGIAVDGCEIFVDYECERTLKGWVPRRLGGGLGGKKESGQLRFGGRDRPFRKPIMISNPATWNSQKHTDYQRDSSTSRSSRSNRDYDRTKSYM